MFLVEKNAHDKTGDALTSFARALDREAAKAAKGLEKVNRGMAEHNRKWSEEIKERREKRKRRGFFGRLLGIDIPF